MATLTKEKALVTVCNGEWDYSAFYDLAEINEESALAVAQEAAQTSQHGIHCVYVEVWEGAEKVATFGFDREELKAE
jgi:hypothetical protein